MRSTTEEINFQTCDLSEAGHKPRPERQRGREEQRNKMKRGKAKQSNGEEGKERKHMEVRGEMQTGKEIGEELKRQHYNKSSRSFRQKRNQNGRKQRIKPSNQISRSMTISRRSKAFVPRIEITDKLSEEE
jgi:hypothetical protein